MNIAKRLFTYPVLSDENSDYVNSKFEIMIYPPNINGTKSITFSINVELQNDDLIRQLKIGNAKIYMHIECTTTGFRHMYELSIGDNEITIDIGKLNGRMEFLGLLLATNTINDYSSSCFSDDFEDMTFNFKKGAILAYKNIDYITLSKKMEEFKNLDSIFVIHKLAQDGDVPMSVDMNNSKIVIWLGSEQHSIYFSNKSNQNYQSVLNSLIVFPVLVYVIQDLTIDGEIGKYENKEWFIAIDNNFRTHGKNFVDELESGKDALIIAQEIMGMPISRAFEHLPMLNADFVGENDYEN